jgi:hypothetical protein
MGRRPHKPDPLQRRQVEAMAAYGIPEIDISLATGRLSVAGPAGNDLASGVCAMVDE